MNESAAAIKVAAYQMNVTADVDENFAHIVDGIRRAAQQEAKLLALPECALSGYPPLHHAGPDQIDMDRIADRNDQVCSAAKTHSIAVILGTVLTSPDGVCNSALVISSEGEVVGRYDKLHLMPDDKEFFVPGRGVSAFDLGGIRLGVLICYDARFPEPFRYLRGRGAKVIAVISNACGRDTWKLPVLEGTYRTRASENSCFVVAVNAAGPLQMATSRIVDPLGLDLAGANPDRDELLFAEIDITEADSGYYHDRRTDQFEVRAKFAD